MSASCQLSCGGCTQATLKEQRPRGGHAERVRHAVAQVISDMIEKYNVSIGFGYVDAEGAVSLAEGPNDRGTGAELTTETRIPLGSVTKSLTAVQLLQAYEAGKIDLNDRASKWVDPALRRLYNYSLADLWDGRVKDVRVRDLIAMTTGFDDYDDNLLREWTLSHPTEDLDPIEYLLSAASREFVCEPGTCAKYSGANYILAGFVLLELQGGYSWEDLDQMAVFPPHLLEDGHYRNTGFTTRGQCSNYPNVAHQYATDRFPEGKIHDMWEKSCANGWTMGNALSTGEDLARFWYDLFARAASGGGFLNATTIAKMTEYKPMIDLWCYGKDDKPGGCVYALGLEGSHAELDVWTLLEGADERNVVLTGHNGQNWGSGASPCGYNAALGFGVCVTLTQLEGLNSDLDAESNADGMDEVACRVYAAAVQAVAGPHIDCSGFDWDDSEGEDDDDGFYLPWPFG